MGVRPNPWDGTRVLVTGAAGLLGGWVCRHLYERGASVTGLDIDWPGGVLLQPEEPVVRIDGDVRDPDTVRSALRDHDAQVVIHLAAQAIVGVADERPVETFEHNILGTWTLLDAIREHTGIRSVVVASSDKAYGDHAGEPYVESMALVARHPYAASKTCTDVLAQTYATSYGLPVGISRSGNMYGGGDTEWSRIVPGTIRSVLEGRRPEIRSDGSNVRDYLYVEDVAEGVVAIGAAVADDPDLAGEAFNIAAHDRHSVLAIVEAILRTMGSHLEPEILGIAINEIPEQRVDASKIRGTLGWAPRIGLEEGLARTIGWYRDFLA
jgi:CDP-glucose 4,6-dehydratase